MTSETARKPIDKLAIDYDVPMSLASCLVRRTPAETDNMIAEFKSYIAYVIDRHKEYLQGE